MSNVVVCCQPPYSGHSGHDMARTLRHTPLETRAARLRLKPRGKPYRAATGKSGLHIGYRRLAGRNGVWVAFTYQGTSGRYSERAFAQADDYAEADGSEVLTYYEAMARLGGEAPPVRHGGTYTVADAVADYVAYLTRERKTARDARLRLHAYVIGYMGERRLADLKPADFDAWLDWALTHSPRDKRRASRRAGSVKPHTPPAEQLRRRKSTVNRVINYLKAALDRAYAQGHVESRDAWARLRKFQGVESARLVRLSADQAVALLGACPPDFGALVRAALLTGCRYGELTRLRSCDFDPASGTLLVAESKAGRPRRVPLTVEGQRFFAALGAGRAPDDILLTKADGSAWGTSEQQRRIAAACAAAGVDPPVNFHALRHTFASWLAEAGTPLAFVAEVLGHSDTRMVSKHYGHLAPSVVHAAVRANLPALGEGLPRLPPR